MAADVVVRFLADTTQLKAGMAQASTSGDKMAATGKKIAVAMGAAFAVTAVVRWGSAMVTAAEDSEKATKRLENVFASMGDTTGEAASEAIKYASALSKQIAVEDEVIMAAQAKLATFKAVSNETARSAGIFDRATKATADLAATGFGTLETNAVQLGKALQDPVKGITALGRAGVTFTDDQKKLIASLVDTGDLLGAQKVILKAVEEQVGGTAAATATASDKMKVAFSEVQESLGAVLLPVVKAVSTALAVVATVFTDLPQPIQIATVALVTFVAAAGALQALRMSQFGQGVISAFTHIGDVAKAAGPKILEMVAALRAVSLAQLGMVGLAIGVAAAVGFLAFKFLTQKDAVDQAREAGKAWADRQIENARAVDDTALALDSLTGKQTIVTAKLAELREAYAAENAEVNKNATASNAAGQATNLMTPRMIELQAAIAGLEEKNKTLSPEIAKLKRELDTAASAAGIQKGALDDLAASHLGVAAATDQQRKSLQDLNNAYLGQQSTIIAYAQAQVQVQESEAKLAELQASGTASALELEKATLDVAASKVQAANAAFALQASEAELAALLKDKGVGGLIALRDTLVKTIETHGDASGAVQTQIDKINGMIEANSRVQPTVATKATFDNAEASARAAAYKYQLDQLPETVRTEALLAISEGTFGYGVPRFAAGGVVPGPKNAPVLAVVHGGETIIPTSTTAGVSSSSGGGSGGPTFNIKIDVASGVPPAQVGAAVVDQIRAYERQNGKSWRAS